jgi:hypothetical protein
MICSLRPFIMTFSLFFVASCLRVSQIFLRLRSLQLGKWDSHEDTKTQRGGTLDYSRNALLEWTGPFPIFSLFSL